MGNSMYYPVKQPTQGQSGDKILVSNAQSKELTESLVSATSSRDAVLSLTRSKMLEYSEISPMRVHKLPKQSENRFMAQMKEM